MGDLWKKEVDCTVCKSHFKTFNVRTEAIRLKSRDTDLMGKYEGVNPNWYDVWVCPECFYAAFRHDFFKLTQRKIQSFKERRDERIALARGADFTKERNPYLALLSYQLGAHCYAQRRNSSEKVASLYMRAAWLARENKSWNLEKDFLEKAVQYYKRSYESETGSSIDPTMVAYLIGELERRLGNYEESIKYLSQVFKDRDRTKNLEVRRLAHDQYFLVKDILRKTRRPGSPEIVKSLKRVDFFSPLSEKDFIDLAESVDWKVFDRGEVIIKEGDEGDTFFIIREGEVSVRIKKNGKKKEIATLGQGSFFGEMSLLTGEPRRATVVARDECELLIVGREHFAGIILKNPSVAEGMSRILVKRKGRIDSELKRRERASEKEKSSWNAFSLFLQIKNVFKT